MGTLFKVIILIFVSSFCIAQNCNKPPSPQTNVDERFMPLPTDPNKVMRVNLVFLHRPKKGTDIKASKERDDEFQAYMDKVIGFMKWQISDFLYEEVDNQKSKVRIDSKIRLDFKKVFIDDYYGWNNENDNCRSGCPDLNNCDWYLNYLSDSLNLGLPNHKKRLNIFLTENEAFYEKSLLQALSKEDYIGGDCSMGYKTDLSTDHKIHMRNEYTHYMEKYWLAHNDEKISWETAREWGIIATARTLLHEIGHTIFGVGHIRNGLNIMDGGPTHNCEHIRKQQLIEAHQVFSTHNMRKYIDMPEKLSHDFIIEQNETWDYDMQLWGNLIIKQGTTLTISCGLKMPPNSKIIIEKGAELIIDGASVQPAFSHGDYHWQGIITKGNKNWLSEIFNPKKYNMQNGKLTLINGGEIIL